MGTTISQLERAALAAYGSEYLRYYNGFHPTSRYFDRLIESYLDENPLPTMPHSIWLEAGSGRGRLHRYADQEVRFVRTYLDISPLMLATCQDDPTMSRIVGSAFRMPFRDSTFDGVASFLGDSFNTIEYLNEAHRVLRGGGHLVHVVPTANWGHSLRRLRGEPLHLTTFIGRSGRRLLAPSLLSDRQALEAMIHKAGFEVASVKELRARSEETLEELPEDIRIVASEFDVVASELPVLIAIHARSR